VHLLRRYHGWMRVPAGIATRRPTTIAVSVASTAAIATASAAAVSVAAATTVSVASAVTTATRADRDDDSLHLFWALGEAGMKRRALLVAGEARDRGRAAVLLHATVAGGNLELHPTRTQIALAPTLGCGPRVGVRRAHVRGRRACDDTDDRGESKDASAGREQASEHPDLSKHSSCLRARYSAVTVVLDRALPTSNGPRENAPSADE
jgi:hypothetical protein